MSAALSIDAAVIDYCHSDPAGVNLKVDTIFNKIGYNILFRLDGAKPFTVNSRAEFLNNLEG